MFRKVAVLLWTLFMAITMVVARGKALDPPEQDIFHQNQLEVQPEEPQLENALIRYLLTKEWLNRAGGFGSEMDERQKKRSYWKQCAFNAVSCFGK